MNEYRLGLSLLSHAEAGSEGTRVRACCKRVHSRVNQRGVVPSIVSFGPSVHILLPSDCAKGRLKGPN